MASTKKISVGTFAATIAVAILTSSSLAVDPVAVWDGAVESYNFCTLTRTSGGLTYTLAVNSENATVSDAHDYITIGSENQKWTVTITAEAGAFGSTADSGFTVIAKVSNAGTSESANRAILNYFSSFREAGAALAQAPNGCAFPMVDNTAWTSGGSPSVGSRQSAAWTLKSDGTIQTLAMSFGTNPQGGTAFYIDGTPIYKEAAMTSQAFEAPEGISLGGVAIDGSTKLFALKGMKIYAVAVFNTRLTDEQVAAFAFPSCLTVSAINAEHGSASEITVEVADGATVMGDTTFRATKVNFTCAGSFTLRPPAGNKAAFDFSGVTGKPRILYEGALPAVSGTTFTSNTIPTTVANARDWTGTIWLRNISVTDFNVNSYGNASSCVRLTGISGWVTAPGNYTYTNNVPVELSNEGADFALQLTNGNSANSDNPLRCTAFVKVSGDGTFCDYTYAQPVIKVFDLSEFSGTINLSYGPSLVVCDSTTVYDSFYAMFGSHSRSIRIESGKAVTVAAARTWTAKNIYSDGTLSGTGKISVGGDQLPDGSSFTNEAWKGTLSIANIAEAWPLNMHLLGNAGSTVELSSIGTTKAYLAGGTMSGKVVLTDNGDTPALALSDGLSDACTTFGELAGTGTLVQKKTAISQGFTVNVMTNFTGTLALTNLTVTFGTTARTRQTEDAQSKLFIDSDAVFSVPAGFSFGWDPIAIVLDGPVMDFTTDATDYVGLVLLNNIGSVAPGGRFAVTVNGAPLDANAYVARVRKAEGILTVLKRYGKVISIR